MSGGDPGFGIYVHWPFCAAKCPYCDFNSHVRFGGIDEPRFLAAFQRELDHTAELLAAAPADPVTVGPLPISPEASLRLDVGRARVGGIPTASTQGSPPRSLPHKGGGTASREDRHLAERVRTVSSIFIGGGTPSLMSPATVGAILDRIAELWPVDAGAEITLEANPGSVEAGRFRGYRAAGVNRVSLGVQSLRDADLKALGRIHSGAEARAAIEVARTTFDRFSFDLIYARPRQTPDEWRRELAEALALGSSHLSLYQLTIEPETPFATLHANGKLAVPDADAALALYEITQEMTEAAGLPAYEISNHARQGEESRHNLLYWRYGEYAGIGPGAHGRLLLAGGRHATVTERNPEKWLQLVEERDTGVRESILLAPHECADEMLLMGLRLSEGVDLVRLEALSGRKPSPRAIDDLTELGLIERLGRGDRIRATGSGRFVLNELIARLATSFEEVAELSV